MIEQRATTQADPTTGLSQYFQSISSLGRISVEEETSLARAWKERGCQVSRERLITANLRLAIAIAKRYSNRGLPLDELVAEANLGLIRAVDSFEPSGGARLSTYAVYWIRSAIAEAFSRTLPRVRVSRADRLDGVALERARDAFWVSNGRPPTTTELATELKWNLEKVNLVRSRLAGRFRQESLTEHAAVVQAEGVELISEADDRDADLSRLGRMLDQLSPEERTAIELRFGLDAGETRSLNTVAEITGLPRRLARQRLVTAMSKLARAGRAERSASSESARRPRREAISSEWRSVE